MKSKTFVQMVNERMASRSLSLRKVAKDAGMDPSFFSKVLSGKRSPPSNEKILARLAKVLGMDPAVLIVSTGLIPSDLRSLMGKPETLKRLRSPSGGFSRQGFQQGGKRPSPQPPARGGGKSPSFPVPKSPFLSEDLL